MILFNNSAADDCIAVIENERLPRAYRSLRLVKYHVKPSALGHIHGCGSGSVAVSYFCVKPCVLWYLTPYQKIYIGGEKLGLIKLLANAPKAFWQIGLVQFFCWFAFLYMWNYTTGGIAENVWGVDTALKSSTTTPEYQAAGDWCGVLFAVQSIGSILWAMVLPMFKRVKVGYSVSLIIGALGFVLCFFVHDQYMMFIPFLLIGCAWAAMLAMPFALLTNALSGSSSMGAYLGLFNCTICLPQIVAALLGGVIMGLVGGTQVMMLVVSGICLLLGSVAVAGIKAKA